METQPISNTQEMSTQAREMISRSSTKKLTKITIIIAGSGLPPRSARGRPGDDITGDKSVRDLIAKTKGNYF